MRNKARACFQLTKPGITAFVGLSAAAGYFTAVGYITLSLQFLVMLGATLLTSGGAAALNHVAEHGQDRLMRRTATRPLPAGVITVSAARAFGWLLSAAGVLLSLFFLPVLTTIMLALCHLSYVYAYTPLKRRTPLSTLIGAIPGALPVLAGWTATGHSLDVTALALTGVLFMWQIPHFLAIGWLAREDYRRAGCPMLSVVDATGRASARIALAYAAATLVCALVVGISTASGALYMGATLLTGVAYVGSAWGFLQNPQRIPARRLFFSSLIVLPLLLAALISDLTWIA